ncbi:DNA mismatch repair endonuclease MutL [Flavilitoribacter nigricans]|uniref:DNA mismatch repair protein MutL n=1 Tax=Flavilitoribacter nigricans (strain ATCC 23147 / DSM 23189 / NBRC 102662 / NCIMB 1420 / SS-2) TaxID=1122177 RepID=A0A2D0NAF0_FLAN2|nr:DNA mismatch repair endonuclease MutL [Flavilitoribacter nigricans]PHN05484.1 DNA mismatch repair protein MutL [Flavilitoribacter nigricans DSM 23189 = NBRC 102662]
MADVIQLLPDAIVNKIAAGEVIQRPASVVKELMENAIDAGSSAVKLVVKDAGKTLIQVIDDGCGMSETDARMALERHATSKIREAEDLFSIRTMGFRGEAMASIAAVAQMELRTRRRSDELGTRIVIEGSEIKTQEPCQCDAGTNICVKNLFFNIPVRRNFLKSNTVEMRHIIDEFQRIALANSDIFFSLHHNNSEIFHLPPSNLRQRVVNIFGNPYNKRLVPVEEETDEMKLTGFVSKPEFAKKTRGEQFFFVNQRFIRSAYLNHAVLTAYEDLLPSDTYPLYVVFIDIDPKRIDINVHPTKQEIKFEDDRLIYNYLKVAIRHSLGKYRVTPTLDFDQEGSFSSVRMKPVSPARPTIRTFRSGEKGTPSSPTSGQGGGGFSNGSEAGRERNNLQNWEKLFEGLEEFAESEDAPATASESSEVTTIESSWSADPTLDSHTGGEMSKAQREPYQIHATYIASPIKSGFILIDQQAAHERILYERYLEALQDKQASTQKQLFPRTFSLPPADAGLLLEILPQINLLGYDIKEFGSNTFVVHGIPADAKGKGQEETAIDSLLAQYKNNLDLHLGTNENIARSMARSNAIKRGQNLSSTEMQTLIDQLFACQLPFKSPTGRNCFLTFELDELAKRFEKD